ncbi:MAG TPA: hypothetical protein VG013_08985 [Gemmataceae bacterium]|nr:hypothetical protein [Gemmataceae bacterium]
MAKVKGRRKRRGRISSFFRPIFEADPALLYQPSNADLIAHWMEAHPRHTEVHLKRVKQNLANLKSQMRKKDREEGGKGRKAAAAAAGATQTTNAVPGGRPTMDRLEEYIDECLTMARNLDRSGLQDVIKLLRRARNEVVWKMGQ